MTEREYEQLGERMLKAYEDAEVIMLQRVAKRLEKGVTEPGWTEKKLAQVATVREELAKALEKAHKEASEGSEEAVHRAYNESGNRWVKENYEATRKMNVARTAPMSLKVANILSDLNERLDSAERHIIRQFDDEYANVIASASALVAAGAVTNREALQIAMKDFADKGITGFIAENGARWQLGTYAEMALLTAIERANMAGYLDCMEEYGYDLAIISSHAGACPLCEAWEDVIVSVSGNNPDYPSLSDAEADGVFHPRCMHDIYTYYPEIDQGKLKSKPDEIEPPSDEYSVRSVQRYMERNVRKYKARMAASVTQQGERQAYNKVREWQAQLRELIRQNADKSLPREYYREGGRVKLRLQGGN